jgi:heme-degrading monooxygenase HmoA
MKIASTHHALADLKPDSELLRTPSPPYYAVISTSIRPMEGSADYDTTMEAMIRLVKEMPGFLGAESSVELKDNKYYKVSTVYWRDLKSLSAWRHDVAHVKAKEHGAAHFYLEHNIRVCQVIEHYGANLTDCQSKRCAYESRESLLD